MFTWFISIMSYIHTLTFISLLDTNFCVLVALPVHSLPVLLCLPDLLSVDYQVMHSVSFQVASNKILLFD